ncbi:MAG TPA: response regulator transcription factor [Acidimicrobiales bacterium]|nr:response regulator transcription factor [Acidimicrobiales bacterium]
MGPLLVYPDPPIEIARALQLTQYTFEVVESVTAERRRRTDAGWAAAVLVADSALDEAIVFASNLRRDVADVPILLVVSDDDVGGLSGHAGSFSDFCTTPLRKGELGLRLDRLILPAHTADGDGDDLIVYGPLMINPVTYQAMIESEPLDLTYMEYELLKYFAQRPGRVCTREVLLGQVWGYEYYGGARTVDVHVRRLRAKLGEPHAKLIGTVRSVGYRFGKAQWG